MSVRRNLCERLDLQSQPSEQYFRDVVREGLLHDEITQKSPDERHPNAVLSKDNDDKIDKKYQIQLENGSPHPRISRAIVQDCNMSNGYYTNEYQPSQGQQYYGAQQGGYSSYEPPRDDYRHDMAVTRYDDERSRYEDRRRSNSRRGSRSSRSRDRSYYDDRSDYDERDVSRERDSRRSSSRRRSGEPKEKHQVAKDVGATVIGGAVGAFAGRELGHRNGLVTTLGTLAGAFAGHELEKRHEKKKERREDGRDGYSRRSVSRSREEYSDDEYDDDSQRRRSNSRRRSGRYD